MMTQLLTISFLFFFVVSLINVILSTMKSVLTIKATREIATLMNAVSYGFYAMVIKSMGSFDVYLVVVVTVVTNLIGVYFSMWVLSKLRKDKLWKVSIIASIEDSEKIRVLLKENDLGYNRYDINTKYGVSDGLDIYSHTQAQSKILREILENFNVKYHVVEIGKQL